MPNWNITLDDSFSRADTSPGAVGTTTGVGNGWADLHGGVWQIRGGQLVSVAGPPDFTTGLLSRPASEIAVNQRIVFDATGVPGNLAACLRYQPGSPTFYLAFVLPNGPIAVYQINNGSATELGGVFISGFNAAHACEIDFNAVGTSPTVVSLTYTDTVTGVSTSLAPISDSLPALQQSGTVALDKDAAQASTTYTRARLYNTTAPLTAPVPSVVSSSPAGVVLSATASTGGTPPYAYQWYASATPAFTPGPGQLIAGATSLTYTDAAASATAVVFYKIGGTDSTAPAPVTATSTPVQASLWDAPLVILKTLLHGLPPAGAGEPLGRAPGNRGAVPK